MSDQGGTTSFFIWNSSSGFESHSTIQNSVWNLSANVTAVKYKTRGLAGQINRISLIGILEVWLFIMVEFFFWNVRISHVMEFRFFSSLFLILFCYFSNGCISHRIIVDTQRSDGIPIYPTGVPGVENAVRTVSWAIGVRVWTNGDTVQDWCLGMVMFIHI